MFQATFIFTFSRASVVWLFWAVFQGKSEILVKNAKKHVLFTLNNFPFFSMSCFYLGFVFCGILWE